MEQVVCHLRERFPAEAPPGVLWLNVETRKVEALPGWEQRLRWQPFMVGLATGDGEGECEMVVLSCEDEATLLAAIQTYAAVWGCQEVRYSATREFDEMVLRGRFTNACRAHALRAGSWPNLDRWSVTWRNLRKVARPTASAPRGPWDCASRDVPEYWATREPAYRQVVVQHCAQDVRDLVRSDPDVREEEVAA